MRKLLLSLLALWTFVSLSLAPSVSFASPTAPVPGTDYIALTSPQPVSTTGNKIEVIEFFMYHCPACYQLEAPLLDWVKKHGSSIEFKRIHLPLHGPKDVEARMFLTLDAMNLETAMHAKILTTWHVDHIMLQTDQDNIDWAIKNGIDKNKFIDTYYSFSVGSRLNSLNRVAESYLVSSTPTLVIDGRYVTGPALLQQGNPTLPIADLDRAMLQVADYLVSYAKASKK